MTTREEWALGFLDYAGWPRARDSVVALVAHATFMDTEAPFNPLGVTEPDPSAVDFDASGTKEYGSLFAGYGATLAALGFDCPLRSGEESASSYGTLWGCLKEVERIKADPDSSCQVAIVDTPTGASVAPSVDLSSSALAGGEVQP